MKKSLFLILLINLLAINTFAQEALKSYEEDYFDFLSLRGNSERTTLGYRTLSDSQWEILNTNTIWKDKSFYRTNYLLNPTDSNNFFAKGINNSFSYRLYGADFFVSYNSKLPYGQYDGALWQGAGLNTSFTTGLRINAFGFEGTFKPQITWSQNKAFDYLPGVYGDSHSYFWAGNIDLVQRYGDSSYWQYDWGDSEIRYTFYNFTAGFGNQSPWTGPAQINPMTGSNNAPSYPKIDFGLRKTELFIPFTNYSLGFIEGRMWYGKLTESSYFDSDDSNNENVIYGFNASYSPSFIEGLTVGGTKICLTKWANRKIQYLNPFYNDNDTTGIGEDQKASFFVDWLFSQVGFETYLELGIDDYSWNKWANPFHTLIYTLGFRKELPFFGNTRSELLLEFNNNEISQDFQLQWGYMGYYAHSQIKQGYTNNGQIIGNGYSYFGNSQYISYKVYHKNGYVKLFYHRFNPDINYNLNKGIYTAVNPETYQKYWAIYKTFLTIGANSLFFINENFTVEPELDFTKVLFDLYDKSLSNYNIRFSLRIKYNF